MLSRVFSKSIKSKSVDLNQIYAVRDQENLLNANPPTGLPSRTYTDEKTPRYQYRLQRKPVRLRKTSEKLANYIESLHKSHEELPKIDFHLLKPVDPLPMLEKPSYPYRKIEYILQEYVTDPEAEAEAEAENNSIAFDLRNSYKFYSPEISKKVPDLDEDAYVDNSEDVGTEHWRGYLAKDSPGEPAWPG